MTQIIVPANLEAPWGLARIIRRRPPWNSSWLRLPLTTSYEAARDGSGVDVYVIDSGVRESHDEFGGRADTIFAATGVTQADDSEGHGTAVNSLIGGATIGPATGALLWNLMYFSGSVGGTAARIIECLEEALDHYTGRSGTNRPAVVNCSFISSDTGVRDAAAACIDAGMVVVAAAGNSGEDLGGITSYPAENDDAICVAGMSMGDAPQYFFRGSPATLSATCWGSRVDVLAPGQHLWSATITGDSDYDLSAGSTSGAAAMASGIVACMLQGHLRLPDRAAVQAVRNKVLANATTGRFATGFGMTLPDRIAYLDPYLTFETFA